MAEIKEIEIAWENVIREIAQQMKAETENRGSVVLRLTLFLPVVPETGKMKTVDREAYAKMCLARALNNLKHESSPYDKEAQTVIDKVPEYF